MQPRKRVRVIKKLKDGWKYQRSIYYEERSYNLNLKIVSSNKIYFKQIRNYSKFIVLNCCELCKTCITCMVAWGSNFDKTKKWKLLYLSVNSARGDENIIEISSKPFGAIFFQTQTASYKAFHTTVIVLFVFLYAPEKCGSNAYSLSYIILRSLSKTPIKCQ